MHFYDHEEEACNYCDHTSPLSLLAQFSKHIILFSPTGFFFFISSLNPVFFILKHVFKYELFINFFFFTFNQLNYIDVISFQLGFGFGFM